MKFKTICLIVIALSSLAFSQGVSVTTVKSEQVQIWNQFSGRLAAVNSVQIKPQVSGQITNVYFRDGQSVEQGQLLLQIDTRLFEAERDRALAQLETAKSQVDLAESDYNRAKELYDKKAISQRTFDSRKNQLESAKNAVVTAKANLNQAEVNLDYANIKAPISGRVSRLELTLGNLVQAGPNAPVLTTIVSNKKIYVDFEIDDQTYIKHIHGAVKNGIDNQEVPVEVQLVGHPRPYKGVVHSFDNQINPSTGTIRVRAILDNSDGNLLPGMFAQVKMATPGSNREIIIPNSAVGIDQDRRFVYVVENNKTQYREVKLGQRIGENSQVVTSGLKDGEKIVAAGVNQLSSNQTIQETN